MEYLYHLVEPEDDGEAKPPDVSHEREMQALTTLLMIRQCDADSDECDSDEPHLAAWMGFLTCGHILMLCDGQAVHLARQFLEADNWLCPNCLAPGVYFRRLRAV